jgi:hypothetical protein
MSIEIKNSYSLSNHLSSPLQVIPLLYSNLPANVTSMISMAKNNFMLASHDAGDRPETIKINKSLCGVPRGGFFRKSPLAAGGIFLFS